MALTVTLLKHAGIDESTIIKVKDDEGDMDKVTQARQKSKRIVNTDVSLIV